jgi:hypothetical protein
LYGSDRSFQRDLAAQAGESTKKGGVNDGAAENTAREFFGRNDEYALSPKFQIVYRFFGIDEHHPIRLHTLFYVYLAKDGGILDDHVIGFIDSAANPDGAIAESAESDDRLPTPLTAASQVRECLPKFAVFQRSDCHELRQHKRPLPASAVYTDFFHNPYFL